MTNEGHRPSSQEIGLTNSSAIIKIKFIFIFFYFRKIKNLTGIILKVTCVPYTVWKTKTYSLLLESNKND
jgi:hypothetical protein